MDESAREAKGALRLAALARRDALSPEWRAKVSVAMAAAAEVLAVSPKAAVSGFWPIRSEIDVRPLLRALERRGARICLPAIMDRTTIVFREARLEPGLVDTGLVDAGLVDMGFGTRGPGPEARELRPDLMLVPLAAFDARGHRIGYGAGYYDRAIARLGASGAPPRLVGTAFDCQEVERVPDEPHDIALQEILTESGLRRLAGSE